MQLAEMYMLWNNYLSLSCCTICECVYVGLKVERWLLCNGLFALLGSLWNGLRTFSTGRILYSVTHVSKSPSILIHLGGMQHCIVLYRILPAV